MTPPPPILEARCDVWTCGGNIPDLSLAEVESILSHPDVDGYVGQPARILPTARFMVTLAQDFLSCFLDAVGCLDLALRRDPPAAGFVTMILSRLPPEQWRLGRMIVDGCLENLPGDRERLRVGISRGLAPRTDMTEFNTWHDRAKAARASADWFERRIQRAKRGVAAGADYDIQSLDRITVGCCLATTANLCADLQRSMERMEEAFRGEHARMGRGKGCVLM